MPGTSYAQPPQKFRISLDRTGQVYHPGDSVTGKVVLHSPEDEEVVNVNIAFCTIPATYIVFPSDFSAHPLSFCSWKEQNQAQHTHGSTINDISGPSSVVFYISGPLSQPIQTTQRYRLRMAVLLRVSGMDHARSHNRIRNRPESTIRLPDRTSSTTTNI